MLPGGLRPTALIENGPLGGLLTDHGTLGSEGELGLEGGGGVDGVEVGSKETRHGLHQTCPLRARAGGRE